MIRSKSFNEFEKLNLKGNIKILLFGESKNKSKKIKKKIIKKFYSKLLKSKL